MREAEFKAWLLARSAADELAKSTVGQRLYRVKRVEGALGDLDPAYEKDKLEGVLRELTFTQDDISAGRRPLAALVPRSENPIGQMRSLRKAVRVYRQFLDTLSRPGDNSGWPELEAMRFTFLDRCPDFDDFTQKSSRYFIDERAYKDQLIDKLRPVVSAGREAPTAEVGEAIMKAVSTGSGMLVRWQTMDSIKKAEPAATVEMFAAIATLTQDADDIAQACADVARTLAASSSTHGAKGLGGADILSVVSSVGAIAHPEAAVPIRKSAGQKAASQLLGHPVFESAVPTASEFREYFDMVGRIYEVMRDRWGWQPRDLIDVQGFLWVVTDDRWAAPAEDEGDGDEMDITMTPKHPLNQILYGPPGTGKTWNTARIAVEICNGSAPLDREALMTSYRDLVRANRIAFTTFHQSIGYEDFVEGLRPTTGADEEGEANASGGFRLEARNGIFRDISALAERARKRGGSTGEFDFTGRQFFKMSLGRASTEGHIYDAAIGGGYIVLGWGGEVDWSDPKYEDYQEIFDRWQKEEPGASGNSGNISQVWRFRSSMKKGDIVIVSEGNLRFRAIGEIVGDYEFAHNDAEWNHRRRVKWLAVIEPSLPIETIHDGRLSQVSCYLMTRSRIKTEALRELIAPEAPDSAAPPEPFVLIIDEINRANISKVLGELITLIEPDKRLGEGNALTVKLPYSGADFGVPNNLYIIGTMNTADRSIALLDTALRRRFHFVEMMPDYDVIDREVEGVRLSQLLAAINKRVEWLFDRDHQIGHSVFTEVESKAGLDDAMRRKIIPLLVEYFYEDWEKVRAALNDAQNWFIGVEKLPPPPLLADEMDERRRYSINFSDIPIEAYHAAAQGA